MTRTLLLAGLVIVGLAYAPTAIIALILLIRHYPQKGTRMTYLPSTKRGERYRSQCYWFATGWWFAQDRAAFVPDFSDDFSLWAARKADDYELERVGFLHSIPDLWKEYLDELDTLR